jgi:hypothetical protein
MTSRILFRRALPVAVLAFGLTACEEGTVAPEMADVAIAHDHSGHLHASAVGRPDGVPVRAHGDLFRAVRQETSRFNSTALAQRAGYAPPPPGQCVSHPELGAMGYHWVNGSLVDPVFDPMRPEALLYAPGQGGNLRLVGVEYIVIDVGQPHPHFGHHPFDVGGVPPLTAAGVPHYSLHVWVHETNPDGDFLPYNRNVSCD